ncbi:hypothetical protein F8388_017582, partial [Cannabis sativa]
MAMNGEQKSVPHDLDEKKSHPNSDHVKTKCCTRTKKKGDRGFIEGCSYIVAKAPSTASSASLSLPSNTLSKGDIAPAFTKHNVYALAEGGVQNHLGALGFEVIVEIMSGTKHCLLSNSVNFLSLRGKLLSIPNAEAFSSSVDEDEMMLMIIMICKHSYKGFDRPIFPEGGSTLIGELYPRKCCCHENFTHVRAYKK